MVFTIILQSLGISHGKTLTKPTNFNCEWKILGWYQRTVTLQKATEKYKTLEELPDTLLSQLCICTYVHMYNNICTTVFT